MGKNKHEIEQWKEYRLSILQQKSKSDDDFEKYITYIASGALALTITFSDNISPLKDSSFVHFMAIGWFLLTITLFVNLLSHYLSSKYNEYTVNDIDENIGYTELVNRLNRRNLIISRLNFSTIVTLGLGIMSILIYSIINTL